MDSEQLDQILQFNWVEPRILEIQIRAGVEITPEIKQPVAQSLLPEPGTPFALIEDRVHDYSETMESMFSVVESPDIVFFGVVIHNMADYAVADTKSMLFPDRFKVFSSRHKALEAARSALAAAAG